ncbi:conserved hypothetical protein [Lebetimonas natsushimae]|uniref:DUF883 domain-containing protein n=1 Tax=Lebetimonas natsushimae TaxID=1936991 RepID=A0A292YES9_9BACT|nr:hypothetical protein [Lebetimonas natsushimae]GAX87630.1 conserved hypothetical protein [Lebetimonas natsushimae]
MEKINQTLNNLENAVKNSDEQKASDILNELKNSLNLKLDNEEAKEIKAKLEEILEETKKQALEHPLFAIAVAGIIGFLLGRLSK